MGSARSATTIFGASILTTVLVAAGVAVGVAVVTVRRLDGVVRIPVNVCLRVDVVAIAVDVDIGGAGTLTAVATPIRAETRLGVVDVIIGGRCCVA